jgi:hypothetical protein
MAFLGNGRRLTGSKGEVYTATLQAEVEGDGIANLAEGVHLVTGVAASTAFPSNTSGEEIESGYLIFVRDGEVITPAVGDNTRQLTLTRRCDVTSFSMPFTADEIEVTTLCDTLKRYEKGKIDMAGSLSGIVTIGETTGNDGFLNQFIDIVEQDGTTSLDLYKQAEEVLFGYFRINKDQSIGDELAVFLPINVFGASLGAAQADAQTFETSFRIASFDDPTIKPALYRAPW